MNHRHRPGAFIPAAGPCVLTTLLSLSLCAAAPGPAGADRGEFYAVPSPAGRHLSPEEARLWTDQRVDTPAPHLLVQAADRINGRVTPLRLAVILVEFPDLPADHELHTPHYFETLLFSHGVLPNLSVAEYLEASSQGRLQVTGEVHGWYTVSQKRDYYTNNAGGIGYYPRNSQRLTEEAIYLADDDINFSFLDNEGSDGVPDSGDDDEIVDGIVLVHAGTGREGGGTSANDFISIHWWTPQPYPTDGVFGRYFTLNPEDGSLGVFIHELGHLMGLPDLYDTDGGSYGDGRWSMMAGGFLTDQGVHPTDFDGWCKGLIGFADVSRVFQNLKGVPLAPTVDGGKVYRLWKDGMDGPEYFMVENRQRTGLDASLPGSGLLIYHVDESVGSNRVPNHYKVAVEQADGLYQLENRFNDASIGDDGDPYHEGQGFGRYTTPNSFAYDGTDSYATVYNIQGPDAGGTMTADLSVQAGPLVEVQDITMTELSGNGDGLVGPGELAGFFPRITVNRRPATDLQLDITSLDPLGDLLDTQIPVGTLSAGQTYTPAQPIRVQISSQVPTDPYGLRLDLRVSWAEAPPRDIPVELGIGTVVGRDDDFESGPEGWTHAPVRPTARDLWYHASDVGAGGSGGFRSGYLNAGYLRDTDGVLVSPPILLPPRAALFYDQLVDVLNPDTMRVQAGGVIELSVNGGDWQQATPDGGYPTTFDGDHLEWIGRPLFAGSLMNRQFYPVRVDLSSYRGSVRVRFRFFSEVEMRTAGLGWKIDNVRVESDFTPVRIVSVDSAVRGQDVELRWQLATPLPSAVRWLRGTDPGRGVPVGTGWTPAAERGQALDVGAAALLPLTYWLEGLDRDGSVDRWGPYRVAAGPAPVPTWSVDRNPSRTDARFTWSGPLPGDARLEIYDVTGRLVYRNPVGPDPGTLLWSGENRFGRRTPPGIYFARIRNASLAPIRMVRLP